MNRKLIIFRLLPLGFFVGVDLMIIEDGVERLFLCFLFFFFSLLSSTVENGDKIYSDRRPTEIFPFPHSRIISERR